MTIFVRNSLKIKYKENLYTNRSNEFSTFCPQQNFLAQYIYIYIVITLINAHIDIRDILQQFIREDREARIHIATINKFSLGCGFCAPTAAEINTGMQEK